jgi:Zn-finger nucleic acid-binding protein
MEKVRHQSIEVDRCTGCHGLWFDLLEQDRLARMARSEVVDDGDVATGRRFDKVDHIRCPVCGSPLIRMVDRRQAHIHYESCTVCHGAFFDAGEFRDYKSYNVLDVLEDLLTPERD